MANLNENNSFDEGVYQIETADRVLGGPDGIANRQAKALANRTKYLKAEVEKRPTIADLISRALDKGAALVGWMQSGTGAVDRTVGDKLREFVSVKDFGAKFDFNGTTGTDDSAAWAAAISWAVANYPKTLHVNDGFSLCRSAWPVIDKPVSIVSNGRSYVCFSSDVTGQCVTVRNTGFANESNFLPVGGNTAFTDTSHVMAGPELVGFWLLGNRSAASKQHGLVFEGNCDFARVDLDIGYFSGRGFWAGKEYNGMRGNFRESSVLRVRTRGCGNADGTASITFELPNSGEADSPNLCKNMDLECVFPYGRGIEFRDSRTVANGAGMYGFSGRIMLHGPYPTSYSNNGALLHFEGDVSNMDFEVNVAYNRSTTEDIVFERNSSISTYPHDIQLRVRHPNSLRAYKINYGSNINIDVLYAFTLREFLTLGASFFGPLAIENQSDALFLSTPSSFTLNGTNAIALTGWTGAFNNYAGMQTFMPVVNANGDGDTMKVSVLGKTGTITRSGNVTLGTETYTFTPDTSATNFIPANSYFSKFVISDTNAARVSGRYDFSPADRYGVSLSDFWASKRLLKFGPWQMWVQNSNGVPRISYGEPTSDTSGRALAVWNKQYVGTSATPSVAGANILVANYASPTTLTNLTGGVANQVVTIVATNGNCTIQNNTNIVTKTAANITLTAKQVVQFVYSDDLSQWIQVQ